MNSSSTYIGVKEKSSCCISEEECLQNSKSDLLGATTEEAASISIINRIAAMAVELTVTHLAVAPTALAHLRILHLSSTRSAFAKDGTDIIRLRNEA